jgi:ribose 5-phosphate isomerase B
MQQKTVSIGCDHAGFSHKDALIEVLRELGYTVQDFGTHSEDSVDYPDFVHPVASQVNEGIGQGVLICGSANGVAITANKYAGVRAAICWDTELAVLARSHNDANIICVPARFVSTQKAQDMLRAFLETEFEGGRHQRRVEKINTGLKTI